MSQKKSIKENVGNYLYKHRSAKKVVNNIYAVIMLALSALIFSFGFRAFVSPEVTNGDSIMILATGGMSGLSQVFVKITQFILGREIVGDELNTFQSIYFFIFNIPIVILAYKGIGKRFALYTIINVVLSSILLKVLPSNIVVLFEKLATDNLTRSLFAGICTGLSSSLALMVDGSAGGLDVISYYIALKKSTSVGKYVLMFNGAIVTLFTALSYLPVTSGGAYNTDAWVLLIYACVYLFVVSLVVDHLSKRNKKAQIQIITTHDELQKILLSNFKHGCTVVDAKGAFSGEGKKIIYMVVTSIEVKKVISIVREYDPQSFINVVSVQALYGQFHVDPIK